MLLGVQCSVLHCVYRASHITHAFCAEVGDAFLLRLQLLEELSWDFVDRESAYFLFFPRARNTKEEHQVRVNTAAAETPVLGWLFVICTEVIFAAERGDIVQLPALCLGEERGKSALGFVY